MNGDVNRKVMALFAQAPFADDPAEQEGALGAAQHGLLQERPQIWLMELNFQPHAEAAPQYAAIRDPREPCFQQAGFRLSLSMVVGNTSARAALLPLERQVQGIKRRPSLTGP